MSNYSDVVQLQQLIIQTCELMGIELEPRISYFELWNVVCEELSSEILNKLLIISDRTDINSPLISISRAIILKELQKRGEDNE